MDNVTSIADWRADPIARIRCLCSSVDLRAARTVISAAVLVIAAQPLPFFRIG